MAKIPKRHTVAITGYMGWSVFAVNAMDWGPGLKIQEAVI